MTGSQPDPHASDDDLDPTGVRALLANLPDPGPMPDDLMARISQSLELEQERRAAAGPVAVPVGTADRTAAQASSDSEAGSLSAGSLSADSATSGSVVSLAAERQRRRPGRTVLWLGGAAAVAMVATVSVNQLIGTDSNSDSGVAANVPVSTGSADSGGEAGGASEDEAMEEEADDAGAQDEAARDDSDAQGTDSPAEQPPLAEDGGADIAASSRVYTATGTVELDATGWAGEVSAWLAADLAQGDSTWGATQAVDCLSTGDLDTGQANRVVLSDARWADEPATLVVAEAAAGDRAWVLTPDCTRVLSGPTTLD